MSSRRGFQELRAYYRHYVDGYRQYLKCRGYGDHVHDWFFVKRGFLECWFQPGFHRFWQVWNPGIGYLAFKVYLSCGGKDRRNISTLATFLVSGLAHNLVVNLLTWRWDIPLPFAFTLFGILTLFFKWLEGHTTMIMWPRGIHLALNVGLVIISFDFGFRMNDLIHSILLPRLLR